MAGCEGRRVLGRSIAGADGSGHLSGRRSASSAEPVLDPCLAGGGDAGALLRAIDWRRVREDGTDSHGVIDGVMLFAVDVTEHGGLGLGLATAKNLVEMHGGTIEARSDGLGQGATFIVRVPVAALRRAPPSTPPAPARVAAQPQPQLEFERPAELRELRLLVGDDEPDARELVAAVMAECGAVVRMAASAAAAFCAFEAEAPDVLSCDTGMHQQDGYGLIARVRALSAERGGDTPAACLTGYTTVDDRRRALQAGFNMHLSKPIEPPNLSRR